MANLSVIFNMVDNISQKLSGMGREIGNVADSFESIEDASDSAFTVWWKLFRRWPRRLGFPKMR